MRLLEDPRQDEGFLLELLNTTPVVDGVRADLLLSDRGAQWTRGHGGCGSGEELEATRAARDLLQRVARSEADLAVLLPLVDGVTSWPTLHDDGLAWVVEVPAGRGLAVRAVLAHDAVQRSRPGRLKPCGNERCALFLLDRSKAANARWCSMATCGNRMKARRHYDRTRT